MTIEDTIKSINSHLDSTDDISQLSDWYFSLSSFYAQACVEIGKVKRERAGVEIRLKGEILEAEGKFTEKDIERRYYATEDGRYLVYNQELIKGIGRLISAIKTKLEMLKTNL